jgi:nucleotide-binding universal stress UspA family protein
MSTVLLCTDGSDLSRAALAEGMKVLDKPDRVVLAMAVPHLSPVAAFGGGPGRMASSAAGDQETLDAEAAGAHRQLEEVGAAMGLTDPELHVLGGPAGEAICALAASLPATAIVLGTRGHGGLVRAVLGSVSDHVVRHASCPVIITGPAD